MTDLVHKIAEIIDPHAFDLGSRAHPEWAEPRKVKAIEKAIAVVKKFREDARADAMKHIEIVHED